MSFMNTDPASCSTNNALNKFHSHTNVDHSLNNQLQSNSQINSSSQHFNNYNKLNHIDSSLQSDFQSFGTQSFQTEFQQQQQEAQVQLQVQQQAHQPLQYQQEWISDFQHMNISSENEMNMIQQKRQQLQQPQHQQQHIINSQATGWSSEFNQMSQKQNHIESQDSFQANVNRLRIQPSGFGYQSGFGQTIQQGIVQQHPESQQQHQEPQTDFDSAFSELETELNQSEMDAESKLTEEEFKPQDESDKIKFAQLAMSVFNTMSNTPSSISTQTSSKFKNSNFLKLMNKISTREVEINSQNDKFVDSKGNDIRDLLPDPLKDFKDGELNGMGAFDSAKVVHDRISGELRPSSWETTI